MSVVHILYPFLIGLISNLMWPSLVRSVASGKRFHAATLAFVNGVFFVFFVKSLEHGISSGLSWCVGLACGMFISLTLTERKKQKLDKNS